MQMRVFCHSGKADAAERLPSFDRLTRLHLHAAARHMAILRFPASGMCDEDAVAAFNTADRFLAVVAHGHVRFTVPHANDATLGSSDDVHTCTLSLARR
jgi:hypothetical protein